MSANRPRLLVTSADDLLAIAVVPPSGIYDDDLSVIPPAAQPAVAPPAAMAESTTSSQSQQPVRSAKSNGAVPRMAFDSIRGGGGGNNDGLGRGSRATTPRAGVSAHYSNLTGYTQTHTPRSNLLKSFVGFPKLQQEEDAEDEDFVLGGSSDSSSSSSSSSRSSRGRINGRGGASANMSFDSRTSAVQYKVLNGAADNDSVAVKSAASPETHELKTQRDNDAPNYGTAPNTPHGGFQGLGKTPREKSKRGNGPWWHPRIPKKHQHSLGPWDKLVHYRRAPCKLLLNVILLMLLLAQVFAYDVVRNLSDENERDALIKAFMPSGFLWSANQNYVTRPTFFFFTPDSITSHFASTVDLYYGITGNDPANVNFMLNRNVSFEDATRRIEYERKVLRMPEGFFVDSNLVRPPRMTAWMRSKSERLIQTAPHDRVFTADLTTELPYGPFFLSAMDSKKYDAHGSKYFRTACAPRADFHHGGYYTSCRRNAMRHSIFDVTDRVQIELGVHQMIKASDEDEVNIYIWTITLMYDFTDDGLCKLEISVGPSVQGGVSGLQPMLAVSILILIAAFWDFCLRIRTLVRLHRYRREMRQRFRQRVDELQAAIEEEKHYTSSSESGSSGDEGDGAMRKSSSSNGSSHGSDPEHYQHHLNEAQLKERLARFQRKWREGLRNDMGRSWSQFALISDGTAIAFAIMNIIQLLSIENSSDAIYTRVILLGLSAMLTSTLLISHMRFTPRLYYMIRATSAAMPHLAYFFVAVGPIFVSFALFGTVVFGSYSAQFSDFGKSCVALYAAIFGDSLLQMFQVTGATNNRSILWASRFFCATFIGFFMWIMLNVALAIVVESYAHVRESFGLWEVIKDAEVRLGVGEYGGELLLNRSKEQIAIDALNEARHQLKKAMNALEACGQLNMDSDSSNDDIKKRPMHTTSLSQMPLEALPATPAVPNPTGDVAGSAPDGTAQTNSRHSSTHQSHSKHRHHHHHHHRPNTRRSRQNSVTSSASGAAATSQQPQNVQHRHVSIFEDIPMDRTRENSLSSSHHRPRALSAALSNSQRPQLGGVRQRIRQNQSSGLLQSVMEFSKAVVGVDSGDDV